MKFNAHSGFSGQHAFLSPSKYHWVNYSPEKLSTVFARSLASEKGTILHDFARQCIELNVKLPRSKKTLNQYVNDALGFRMIPEQMLFYSPNAFGTADAISFRNNQLRIHDLKTGVTKVNMTQLEIYTAFFCLEYEHSPNKINIELRIYWQSEIIVHIPEPMDIRRIMDKIVHFDKMIDEIRELEETIWLA